MGERREDLRERDAERTRIARREAALARVEEALPRSEVLDGQRRRHARSSARDGIRVVAVGGSQELLEKRHGRRNFDRRFAAPRLRRNLGDLWLGLLVQIALPEWLALLATVLLLRDADLEGSIQLRRLLLLVGVRLRLVDLLLLVWLDCAEDRLRREDDAVDRRAVPQRGLATQMLLVKQARGLDLKNLDVGGGIRGAAAVMMLMHRASKCCL